MRQHRIGSMAMRVRTLTYFMISETPKDVQQSVLILTGIVTMGGISRMFGISPITSLEKHCR